jgi:hypothetical protein
MPMSQTHFGNLRPRLETAGITISIHRGASGNDTSKNVAPQVSCSQRYRGIDGYLSRAFIYLPAVPDVTLSWTCRGSLVGRRRQQRLLSSCVFFVRVVQGPNSNLLNAARVMGTLCTVMFLDELQVTTIIHGPACQGRYLAQISSCPALVEQWLRASSKSLEACFRQTSVPVTTCNRYSWSLPCGREWMWTAHARSTLARLVA